MSRHGSVAASGSRDRRERVVGRTDDLDRIAGLLFGPGGQSGTIFLSGEAGIGKTTVWRAAIDEAGERGYRVLSTSGAEAEAQLSLAGARDLVTGGLAVVAGDLSPAELHALRVLLLKEDPGDLPPDPGATAAAFRSMVHALAALGPVLIAVDDIQWLDAASASMLAYALRRLDDPNIVALLAWRDPRDGSARPAPFQPVESTAVELGPLSFGAVVSILRAELQQQIPRSTLRHIHEASGGNPLFAIELARALQRPTPGSPVGGPMPVPGTLRGLLRQRLSGLPPETTRVLGLASALAHPTLSVLEQAEGVDLRPVLDPAIDAGVVAVSRHEVQFRHPLIGETAYELASPSARREMHRRLAEAVDDLEERARHLALGTDRPIESVAAEVEEAARLAFLRGSPGTAADLAANAVRLTPEQAGDALALPRRRLAEIDYQFAAGDTRRASVLLDGLLRETDHGPVRASLLARRARLHHFADDIGTSVAILREALAEAGSDDELRAGIEEGLAWGLMMIRSDLPSAAIHAESAAQLAERAGNDATQAEALAAEALARCLTGQSWAPIIDRALALEPATLGLRVLRHPSFAHAYILGCTDDLDGARSVYAKLAERAARQGDESAIPSICNHLGLIELQTGDWAGAERTLADGAERARESDQRPSLTALLGKQALLAARRGEAEVARSVAREALEMACGPDAQGDWLPTAAARGGESAIWALAHLALIAGEPDEAAAWLAPLHRRLTDAGVVEPGEMPWLGDEIDALVSADRHADAERLLDEVEEMAERVGRRSALAVAARGRGVLNGSRGDVDGARASLDEALGLFQTLPMPFEQARTVLALGKHHRRRHAWREARTTLTEARHRFEVLGATAWAARASRELDRVGGRAPAGNGLSATEREIASLAAQGRTNREVAAALSTSVNTVESTLTRVYGKLGIRSRTELARRLSDEPGLIS